ncbi:MAG TPA: HEAT repeat domain-containing protein [Phycisphaerae bacterium]|nr:HEAT repeat domain-containing protein [Phycisphaerae bacterium]
MRLRICLLSVALAGGGLPAAPAETEPIAEPHASPAAGGGVDRETFGNARNVELLAALAKDPSPVTRETALRDLGKTHNRAAIPHLQAGLKDENVNVRCAAAAAAADFDPRLSGGLILDALRSDQEQLVTTGLRCVRDLKLRSEADAVRELLRRSAQPDVQAAALYTLTRLDLPAGEDDLARLLAARSTVVRLRACENALLRTAPRKLTPALLAIARRDSSAVRAAAMAALGKFDYASLSDLLDEAAGSKDPLVRRGALWAHRHAAKADRIRPFLDDPSPAVRLAATRAAGDLRCGDCAGRLIELLLEVRDGLAHQSARAALRQIGADALADRIAGALKRQARALLEINEVASPWSRGDKRLTRQDGEAFETVDRKRTLLQRNVGSCCRLLGEFKATAGLEDQIALLKDLPADSPVLAEAAPALARIGDPRAVKPLLDLLNTCQENGVQILRDRLGMRAPTVPYDEQVTGAVARALADLDARDAAPTILKIIRTNVAGMRVPIASGHAVYALPKLTGSDNRKDVEKAVLDMMRDKSYGRFGKFQAAKAAGKLKMESALDDLNRILYQERDGRQMMHAAAWAIQYITGKTPEIPDPTVKQGEWIITTIPGK